MRIPNHAHESGPWRIREIAADFRLEDVWALPAHGGAGDFPALLDTMATLGSAGGNASAASGGSWSAGGRSAASGALMRVRMRLGRWLGWDEGPGELPIPGTSETSLAVRLPEDLRGTATGVGLGSVPFVPLYRTDTEAAAELSNQTVHAVLHLAWADQGDGRYQGRMAIYVKPRGALGVAYMAFIKPFRYAIVYPALMRQIERAWNARATRPAAHHPARPTPSA
jgi:hypothetical protein